MLRIKKDVDLKELEKFGFGTHSLIRRDKPEVKLLAYERMQTKTHENIYGYLKTRYKIIKVYVEDRTIHFFNLSGEKYNKNWANDLIQAGLVEKVEE